MANIRKLGGYDIKDAEARANKLDKTGDGSEVTAAFTAAGTRSNIATGEKLSVIFGKISKWFSDLKTVAFTGSYNDLSNKPTIPTIPSSLPASDVHAWAKAANKPSYTASEVGAVEKTVNANVSVLGAAKTTEKHGTNQAVFPNGAIFSGSAASAGLVTRGICGVSTPDASGSCGKDSLFINYDGDNTYRANRQLVLQAGAVGTHYGNNLYQFAAARGDAVKAYVDAAIAAAIAALPVYDGTVS